MKYTVQMTVTLKMKVQEFDNVLAALKIYCGMCHDTNERAEYARYIEVMQAARDVLER